MRILILHSDVTADAPPDDQDTLLQATAVEKTLRDTGHEVARCVFEPDPPLLESALARECPDLVFNLVETVWGTGVYANLAPAMLTRLGVPFTGCGAAALAVCSDKLVAKRLMAGAGLPTPEWSEPPGWRGIGGERWIVKSVSEDASLGLDDGAVVYLNGVEVLRVGMPSGTVTGTTLASRLISPENATYDGPFKGWWDYTCIIHTPTPPGDASEQDVAYRHLALDFVN